MIRRTWRCSAAALVMIFLCAGTATPAARKPATMADLALYMGADRQQILEEGARKEQNLTFYTTHILNRPLVEAFQKKYPFIKVDVWRAADIALLPRILEEYKVGSYLCDVIEGTQLPMLVLQKEGIIQPFYVPNLIHIQEEAITKSFGEGALRVATRESGIGLAFNTKLITREELPKSYPDLLDPKWKGKGKVAIGFDISGRSWMQAMLVTHGEEFVRRMTDQSFDIQAVSSRGILDMIINGEYKFSPTIFDSHVSESKKKGAPVDWLALEPVPVNLGQLALPKHSSHPHAALLFIDFELSKEGAEIHKATGYSPTRKDVTGVKTYKKFYGAKTVEDQVKGAELFDKLFLKK